MRKSLVHFVISLFFVGGLLFCASEAGVGPRLAHLHIAWLGKGLTWIQRFGIDGVGDIIVHDR